jgi:RNA polymerase sigma factor (TIGR02999 family)
MTDVTQILSQLQDRDPAARSSEELLLAVYDELRKLATAKLAREKPGQTLTATALVHEAYIRLVDTPRSQDFSGRGHFFAAASEAMRRILVDNAHRKKTLKRGGNRRRVELSDVEPALSPPEDDLIALDEALDKLADVEPQTAELVKLRYFAGLTNKEAAELLGISPRKADSLWAYARVWLHERIAGDGAAK